MEIEIISKEIIKPSSPTPPHLKTFNLSILDQIVLTPFIPTTLYYPNPNPEDDCLDQALERSTLLKKSLSKTLTQFYPLAGTIKDDLSIDCNDDGAYFVVARVHHRLHEFLTHPNLEWINKFLPCEPSFDESKASNRVTNVQVNVFDCGGMVISLCVSHKILDGAALAVFLKGWTNMACESKEVIYPNLTSPLLFPAKSLWLKDSLMVLYGSLLKQGKCRTKRFLFDLDSITKLKAKASINKEPKREPTRVEVVSALIWKCAMEASKETCGFQKPSGLTHVINLRRKLTSSKDMIGNVIWIAMATCEPNNEPMLHGMVDKVREGITKVDYEFVNKAQGEEGYVAMQDSLKEMSGISSLGSVDCYSFTSWCKLGYYEIDFGWGKPSWVTGVIGDGAPVFMNFVTLMDTKLGDGIEAWVNLDEQEMKVFERNQELLAFASLDPSVIPNGDIASSV